MQGSNYQLDKEPLLMIPIYLPSKEESAHVERVVAEIINGKAFHSVTGHLECTIDNLMYKLYNLTFDEVKLIDPEFALTEAEYNLVTVV